MQELTPEFARQLAIRGGLCTSRDRPEGIVLSGGVSSTVILVETAGGQGRWVFKQPCPRLKVRDEWLCDVERIWREIEVLGVCRELLVQPNAGQSGFRATVPEIVLVDRANYLYAMTAAPAGSVTWKQQLLAGEGNATVAQACGTLLGQLHGRSWNDGRIASQFDDRTFFSDLRLSPYYRRLGEVHADLQPTIDSLVENVLNHRVALVHGDFSPKNLLVASDSLVLIDFEVGHFGDPAFDLGFFLTHLVAKHVHLRGKQRPLQAGDNSATPLVLADVFWDSYRAALAEHAVGEPELAELEERAMLNLAGCLLARVDGKSPLEYLAPTECEAIRRFARQKLIQPAPSWSAFRQELVSSGLA
jgi:5-methylthioribose kinase